MNTIEFLDKIKYLGEIHNREVIVLKKDYVNSNNTIGIGQIIRDLEGYIQVKSIGVYLKEIPCCYYDGIVLSNKQVPHKSGKTRRIYQTQIIQDENK